jgi:hypothetical protein
MNPKFGLTTLFSSALLGIVLYWNLVLPVAGQTSRSPSGGRVSVLDFGAVGDGRTDDRAAIQAAIDAGDEIHFPEVPAYYRINGSLRIGGTHHTGSKRLIGHRPCRGGGFASGKPPLIHGDGSTALLVAEGSTAQNRAVELIGISALNSGKPVLDLMSGTDAMIENCSFKSIKNTDAAIRLRDSFNVTISESSLHCLGGGFAVTAYRQCNKLRIHNCRLGGGDNGGAVHIEQSAAVEIAGNIFEPCQFGLVASSGIRLDQPAAGNVDGAGFCHAIRITGNYFENVQHPLVLASAMNQSNHHGLVVAGAIIESNNIGTYAYDFPLLTIGRLQAASIRGNSFWRKTDGQSPAIWATFAARATPAHATDCVIECNHMTNGSGKFLDADPANVGDVPFLKQLNSENRIAIPTPQ